MQFVDTNDEQLMVRFRMSFDQEAIRTLLLRYHRSALALARCWLGNTAVAEDAVQEAFIRLVRERDRYDASRPFAPWFWRILRNTVLDTARGVQRYEQRLRVLALEQDTAPALATEQEELHDLLAILDAEDREILALRFAAGLPFAEIAARLGCSEEAAKKKGQRALARLRAVRQRRVALPAPVVVLPSDAPVPD
ncbi:MAG: hypothetical protein A3K19_11135 [Lentisphaerae bacterium RIFOXYB12_FULL_65_16]|nr:MAG: hypothetical protein A3K18_25705 [Lentisphaerae bacterium RIFOXYA12_64_32]OGV90787.1 MAG: hypothetical protein A3K19_11135 [Lentisphaerae bacterium RIFOXYB12_FULL_65_16]